MTQALMIVTYDLTTAPDAFRADAISFAPHIAGAPGLEWKIWGFDADRAGGASVYLFDNAKAARTFASGPMLAALRSRPDVDCVETTILPVDRELSVATGALRALGAPLMPTMDVQEGTHPC